jgi:hypothetical protein
VFGNAGSREIHFGSDGEHVVAGVFAEDLKETIGSVGYGGSYEECLCRAVKLEVLGWMD